jgi:hypothetical protein
VEATLTNIKKYLEIYLKTWKNHGKVMEFCQRQNVGTLSLLRPNNKPFSNNNVNRMDVNGKKSENITINLANFKLTLDFYGRNEENWFVISTINPLTHSGTKELPPQLLSRFPVRIRLEYPPEDVELEIVKKHVSGDHESEIIQAIKLANTLRQAAAVEELFYSPSLRETIAFGKLLDKGMTSKEVADIVFGNVYTQWGNIEYQKVSDIITSMFGN